MKYFVIATLAYLIISPAAAEQIEMPRAFQGEWCGDGGACPDGWMTVTKSGFVGAGGVRCDLKKARYRASETDCRQLTFKCTDSKKLVEEVWFYVDEMLVVTFALPNGKLRRVQYVPRTKIIDDWGGDVLEYAKKYELAADQGRRIEIYGTCFSACTFAVAIFPQDRICFGPDASLGFHRPTAHIPPKQARDAQKREAAQKLADDILIAIYNAYPDQIRAWLDAKGGLVKYPVENDGWFLFAPALWKMGYQQCPAG